LLSCLANTRYVLQDQLVSVFQVIDQAELRKIELAVYSSPECEPENLLEVWSFRCGYKVIHCLF